MSRVPVEVEPDEQKERVSSSSVDAFKQCARDEDRLLNLCTLVVDVPLENESWKRVS